jgi:hypothetical protein
MNANFQNLRVISDLDKKIIYSIAFMLLGFAPIRAYCEIQFTEVSELAGIAQDSPTAASAWGDFNNDGWPDIWVSNHHGLPPSLYVNQKNGRFVDFYSKALPADLRADFHGAAWADYDNDGDQDIIATTGGAAGRGSSPNYFFVNEHGKLVDRAKELGIDYPLGRGRTPLWVDVNQDGKLDLLLMNRVRQDASSALFVQTTSGFVNKTKEFHFSQDNSPPTEGLFSDIKQWLNINNPTSPAGIKVNNEFAQLAAFADNNQMGLIAYMKPTRFYSISSSSLDEFTDDLELPNISSVDDVAIGDFNGDGQMDMFLARAKSGSKDVSLVNAKKIKGKMGGQTKGLNAVIFRTGGEVTFEIDRPWIDPSDARGNNYPKLFIGSEQGELKNEKFTISTDDASVRNRAPSLKKAGGGVSIEFNPITKEWTLKNLGQQIGFVISSTKNIESFETRGFKPGGGSQNDLLLIGKENKFISKKLRFTDQMTSCSSVTAGDFDNDMDLDLYLVCTGPVENLPNILYENDGNADFRKVKNAGGAKGAVKGRGNQVTAADYNLDGFLDLFVTNGSGPPPFASEGPHQLYRNIANKNHWLEIDLRGVKSNRDGIGAKLIMTVNGKSQVRQQDGGMHSFSQNHARIHFGLGPYEKADLLTIYWPTGKVQRLENIEANQILVVDEQIQPGK